MPTRRAPLPRRAVSPLLAVLALAACAGNGGAEPPTASPTGAPASSPPAAAAAPDASPNASLAAALAVPPALDGTVLDTAALTRGGTVLWFWAPWCTLCRGEAPDLVEVAARHDVDVIGVAGRGDLGAMLDFIDDTGTGGFTHLADVTGVVWDELEVFAQPAFAFIDDSGEVEVFVGTLGEQALDERFAALLDT